jgi:hypothetical protein
MTLLNSGDYDSVRAALLTGLSKRDLPNKIIALDLYSGEAERWVQSQLTIVGPEATGKRAKLAAVCKTAALLAPALDQIISQKDSTGESVQLKTFDPDEKARQLEARATELISLVNGGQQSAQRPTMVVRKLRSCVRVLCPTCNRSRPCGCNSATLVF